MHNFPLVETRPDCENRQFCCSTTADNAVKQVFSILGVDIENPESVEEFREDMRFGRKLRIATNRGVLAIFSVVAASIASLLWVTIENYFRK